MMQEISFLSNENNLKNLANSTLVNFPFSSFLPSKHSLFKRRKAYGNNNDDNDTNNNISKSYYKSS